MRAGAIGLATLATTGAALLVLLIYAPSLQAPFLVPKFAALEVTASLGLVAFAVRGSIPGGPRWTRLMTIGSIGVLATTAVAWVAAVYGPAGASYGLDAFARWASLLALAAGASVLEDAPDAPAARRRLLGVVTVASAAVAAIGLLQHVELLPLGIPIISKPGSTFGNRNAAAEVMAMAIPFGLGVAAQAPRRDARVAIFAALALEIVFLAVTRTRGAWLGAAGGIGVTLFLLKARWSRASIAVALGATVAAAVAASMPGRFNPRDVGDRKRFSGVVEVLENGVDVQSTALKTRLGLWRRTMTMAREHPLLGVGPGNWPVEFPRYAEPGATRDGVLSATLAPRQAHDDLLERAAETGIPGLFAFAFLVVASARATSARLRTDDQALRATTAAAAGALVALLVLGITGFPLEAPGTLVMAGLSLGLIANDRGSLADPATDSPGPSMRGVGASPPGVRWAVGLGAGVVLVTCVAWRAERKVRSSVWLAVAERALLLHRDPGPHGDPAIVSALTHSLEAAPNNYRAQLRLAQTLLRQEQSVSSVLAARRALVIEPLSPNAWATLAAAELASGDASAARRDASQALTILNDYPFALNVRAHAAERLQDPVAAGGDRQRLRELADGAGDTASAARSALAE